MSTVTCFLAFSDFCISQQKAVSGALVTAIAALISTGWKIFSDRRAMSRTQTFEREESEKTRNFESEQAKWRSDTEAAIQLKVQAYINLEKWRQDAWSRTLSRLESASQQLSGTSAGLTALIDDGPSLSDFRMIQETARALDVFGDFQTTVRHFSLPAEISSAAEKLIAHITRILLSLSPLQEVRKSEERKKLLSPLKDDLNVMTKEFMTLCGRFEHDPSLFTMRVDHEPREIADEAAANV